MRTVSVVAFVVMLAAASESRAQFGLFSSSPSSNLQPVGSKVGSAVANPVAPLPTSMIGGTVDASRSVAPVAGTPQGQSYFSAFYAKLAKLNPFHEEKKTGTTGWFPSMGRRNRERNEVKTPVWLLD